MSVDIRSDMGLDMNRATPSPTVEVHDIAGYVVHCGAEFSQDAGRWRPVVSIGEDRSVSARDPIPVRADDLHDSEAQAVDRADVIARKWIRGARPHAERQLRGA